MNPLSDAELETLRERLAADGGGLSPAAIARALRADGRPVGDATVLAAHELLRREVDGAGPLEPLLRIPGVTDVLVNGPDQVLVDRGAGLEETGIRFPDDAAVRRLAQRLAASAGRRLDDASPYADLRLQDGTRFHAVLAPVAKPGTAVSLRVPGRRTFDLAALGDAGTFDQVGLNALRALVAARVAVLVSGGTGSGKTTLLQAMLGAVDPGERLVIVEDSAELRPDHPHAVFLEARPANVEGAGEIDLRTLVRQALRMRPDRLIVGEVRGAEVVDLLAAMNTGHEGGAGTVHANSAADVPARIESLATAAGLSREAVQLQLCSAVDVVVHLGRDRDGVRRLREIGVLRRVGSDVLVEAGLVFDSGVASPGPAVERLRALGRV